MASNGYRNNGHLSNGSGPFRRPAMRRPVTQRGALKAPPHLFRNLGTPRRGGTVLTSVLIALVAVIVLIPTVGAAAGGAYYAQTAAQLKPRLETLHEYKPFQTSRIFDRNGTLLYEFASSGRRDSVPLSAISEKLINATVAVEDKNFWTNPGVDFEGIARAVYLNYTSGDIRSGASTITQQLIKIVVLDDQEKQEGYERKIKEAVLAQQLTREYSKEQILEMYLNEINYGNLAYGIQAAAQNYFGKDASDLDLNEASLLAGLPQSPTYYNPRQHLENGDVLPGVPLKDGWRRPGYKLPFGTSAPRQRQVDVLREMVDNGYATEREARNAIAQDLIFVDPKDTYNPDAPHFVFYVKQLLENDPEIGRLLRDEGGLTITTTLDLDIQKIAQEEAAKRIRELEEDERNIHNAAVVVEQPGTGQILAMVGSVDFNAVKPTTTPGEEKNVLDGKVNVTTAERQPGSALKPFTYLSAMNQGKLTPGSILWDVETRFPIQSGADDKNIDKCAPDPGSFWFCPKNYDQKWHGPLRMREGLANSLNMPAVLALKQAGIGATRNLLHGMGISGLQREDSYYGLAMTLGGGEVTPLDLTTAYNTLANNGVYVEAESILKVTDRDGQTIREFTPEPSVQVVDPALVAIVRDFMGDNEARTPLFGRNNPLKLSRPLYAKTGTTDDFRDAWALGFTPYVTIGVWTGNNNNEKTARVESTQGGGVILNRIMERLFADGEIDRFLRGPDLSKPLEFPSPATFGAVESKVCQIGGRFGQRTKEWFTPQMLEGAAKEIASCDLYRTVKAVRTSSGGFCLPNDGATYGGEVVTLKVWNLPKSEDDAKIVDTKFTAGDDEDLPSVAPSERCSVQIVERPTPTPAPFVAPTAAPVDPATGQPSAPEPGAPQPAPGEPSRPAPGEPSRPAPTAAPAVKRLPNLVGLGENQAKGVLAGLGITNVLVDYQGPDRLGDVYNQFPAYAVVSSSPGAGAVAEPGMTVVLGIRAP